MSVDTTVKFIGGGHTGNLSHLRVRSPDGSPYVHLDYGMHTVAATRDEVMNLVEALVAAQESADVYYTSQGPKKA